MHEASADALRRIVGLFPQLQSFYIFTDAEATKLRVWNDSLGIVEMFGTPKMVYRYCREVARAIKC